VLTPPTHKDANDWTGAGVSSTDLEEAIRTATAVILPDTSERLDSVDLHAPRRRAIVELPSETEESPPTPFPVDLLPPKMGGIVAAVARAERVPLALPGVAALSVASAAIGAGLEVVSGPNRVTRANLFLIASAESGSGKSETFRLIAAPLVDHQARVLSQWRDKTGPAMQSEIAVLKREAAKLEKKAANTTETAERDRQLGELQYRLARIEELQRRAAMPCIIAQDVTTERLAVLLEQSREVMFSTSADARKLVDNLLGRYNPGKMTDESLLLSGYSGDFVRVDRQGRAPVVLHKPCLSLCWFIQPDLLAAMLDEASLSASGFLPRLLVCHTQATPRRIEGDAPGISDSARGQWAQLICDLLTTLHCADKAHRIEPAQGSKRLLDEFHNAIVDRRNGGDLADLGPFAARYAEQAWRLSLVLHSALHGAAAPQHAVELETAQNAVQVVEWFNAQQGDILARGRRQAARKKEDEVLELAKTRREREKLDYVSARDVHRARIVPTAEAAIALLLRMEKNGILFGQDVRPPHGGKVTRVFRVVAGQNPVPE
jgi:hypothetical protein